MNRREFLERVSVATVAAAAGTPGSKAATVVNAPRMTAAIIGHTGRGNWGHGLDLLFDQRANIDVLAVADPDAKGRAAAQVRTKAQRGYADYHDMLMKERPQLVVVAPRWTEQHFAMASAALGVGAHVFCEKPFMRTLAEADAVLATAKSGGLKIAVAHQGRLAPQTLLLKQRIDEGTFGELLEIRVHGKQDRRAGGEDMLVLGTHQFDLVRFFAGDPLWCSARIVQGGREVTLADAHPATEGNGLIIGDEIDAMFALPRGVAVHYTSRAKAAAAAGPWGMELIGTKGRARLLNDVHTRVFGLRAGELSPRGEVREWLPLSSDSSVSDSTSDFPSANRWVVDDWLAAIAENREPICSGTAAMKSLEMIHAVFAAGVSRGRVALPLKTREHPLG